MLCERIIDRRKEEIEKKKQTVERHQDQLSIIKGKQTTFAVVKALSSKETEHRENYMPYASGKWVELDYDDSDDQFDRIESNLTSSKFQ